MPLNQLNTYDMPTVNKELPVLAKKYLYTSAVGVAGAMLLGGEQLGEKGAFLSIELPALVAAGLGIGAGSLAANVLTDYVTPMLFDDSTIRSVENTVIKGSLAAGGSIAGLYYLSGIGPSVNGGLLGLGSFVGGEYLYSMDSSLLGRLF